MRRISAILLVLVALGALFFKPLLGGAMKVAARVAAQAELSFGAFELKDRGLFLSDIRLTRGDAPVLAAPSVALRCESLWPFRWSVEMAEPRFTLTQELAQQFLAPKDSKRGTLAFTDGEVAWSDGFLPTASCGLTSSGQFRMAWGERALFVDKGLARTRIEWTAVPLEWLSRLYEVSAGREGLTDALGEVTGSAEFVHRELSALSVAGTALSFHYQDFACSGDLFIDLKLKTEWVPDRFRISVDHGSVATRSTTVRELSLLATFENGIGLKWESSALAGASMPFRSEGKGIQSESGWEWVRGAFSLGQAHGEFIADKSQTFRWQGVGPLEWAVLRDFARFEWELTAGELSGTLTDASLTQLTGHQLAFRTSTSTLGCASLRLDEGLWTLEQGSGTLGGFPLGCAKGNWDVATGSATLESCGEIPCNLQAHINGSVAEIHGQIDGVRFSGLGAWEEGLRLDLDEIEGEIKPWLAQLGLPLARGSLVGKLLLSAPWKGELQIADYALALSLREAETVPFHSAKLTNLELDALITPDSLEIRSAKADLIASLSNRTVGWSLSSPIIRWSATQASFDVRVEGEFGYLARVMGVRKGSKIELDSRSHVRDAPLVLEGIEFDGHRITQGRFKLALPEAELEAQFLGAASSYALSLRGLPQPLDLRVEEASGRWTVPHLAYGPLRAACAIELYPGQLRVQNGQASWGEGIRFNFEGSLDSPSRGHLALSDILADLSFLRADLEGRLTGTGQLALGELGIETDLDLIPSPSAFKGFRFENAGPLHLHVAENHDISITGVDARVAKNGEEGHGQAELLEIRASSGRWQAQGARGTWPPLELDVKATIGGTLDGLEYSGVILDGSVAQDTRLSQVHFSLSSEAALVEGSVTHKGLTANLFAEASFQPILHQNGTLLSSKDHSDGDGFAKPQQAISHPLDARVNTTKGRLSLQEQEASPLAIEWSYAPETGLHVHSVEGSCGGVDAAFHALAPGKLIGSARFDAKRASDWLPLDIAKAFRELKMGQGYELKGHLNVDPRDWRTLQFNGIFSGKQIELFGYEFRTLLGQVELSRSAVHIYDLQVSDAAGRMNIHDIRMQANGKDPWTLEIPVISVQEFRPSFLHAPKEALGSMTPLVVRQLTLRNLKGLLDSPKTYTASGDAVFINSYKRGETLFDLPSNVFGRVVGLDLELLVPVSGEFSFKLEDGEFQLFGLKNAYSEAGRSEFFLMEPEGALPRMDLDGNLRILVEMKQFVLFKFTEAFAISIEGTIKDPQFRLTKKKSWLSF